METNKKFFVSIIISSILLSTITGGFFGYMAGTLSSYNGATWYQKFSDLLSGSEINADSSLLDAVKEEKKEESKILKIEEESAIIETVEKASPAVVSIIVSKDLPIYEKYYQEPFGGSDFFSQFFGDGFEGFFNTPQYRQNGTEKQEIGGGTGFIVSNDGYIITNKHVVDDEGAEYTVLMNDESKHEAKVLAKDMYNDLAILKIEGDKFPFIELGDSSNLKVGQSVITIGNSLGEFRNTVSTGIISGLARNITAGGRGVSSEDLIDVIQTDAAINPGNSGGPLLNIAGQAIGINTAIAQGAENIGFSIPINSVKDVYESVKKNGRIVRPWLGVRYVLLNEDIAKQNNLEVKKGALIVRGENRTDLAVVPGSPADIAGLLENDIILEVNGKEINETNPLSRLIGQYKVGDEIEMKIFRKGEEKKIKLKLSEMKEMGK